MASFVILQIARTARIACSDRHTYIQTDIRLNHAGVTGADCRHLNDLLLLLEIPVQAVEDTLY